MYRSRCSFDARPVQWMPSFLFALGWSVLVLSVGAISLLYWLLRHGAAANVARLFYLVPAGHRRSRRSCCSARRSTRGR